MSYDLVEVALEKYTDFTLFERLASEMMRDFGYYDITPLGGTWDEGRDAIDIKHFEGKGTIKTVFQYSLQMNVSGKVIETLEKLKVNRIEYQKLIIVTNRKITSGQQTELRRRAVSEFKKDLEFFDREKIIPILGDPERGLMERYFPSLEKQIGLLYRERGEEISETREKSFLKTCSIFYYDKESENVRKTLIDKIIIEILATATSPVRNIQDLVSLINGKITAKTVDDIQVANAIKRLKENKTIVVGDSIVLTGTMKAQISGIESRLHESVNSLISEILAKIKRLCTCDISIEQEAHIRSNSLKTIVNCFYIYGSDIARQLSEEKVIQQVIDTSDTDIAACAMKNLSSEIGSVLLVAIAELFYRPNAEQYNILSSMCRSYLASVILSIDPVLSEFQATKFSKKIFILDTDFVLDTINEDSLKKKKNRKILDNLAAMNCRIVIPRNCIEECINHAKIADRTYTHFNDTLLSLPEEFVDQHVWNAFVKGFYYYRKMNPKSKINFFEYRANFYEEKNEYGFMLDVINTKMPPCVKVVQQKDLIDEKIDEEEIKKLGDSIYEIMKDSRKSKYRTVDEMKKISYLDAELYLIALKLNSDIDSKKSGLLSQYAYIISESNRYIKAVSGKRQYKNIVIRSYSIYSLLRVIGIIKNPRNEMETLADPLLERIVNEMWEDVSRLVKNGIRLDNMNLTRLRWDMDENLHEKLVRIESEDEKAIADDTKVYNRDDDYMEMLHKFRDKGYSLVPEAEALIAIVEEDKKTIDNLQKEKKEYDNIIRDLLSKSSEFGKKKQRYLRKIARR